MHNFNLVHVQDEEGELTDGQEAVSRWSNLDNLLQRTAIECQVIFGNVDVNLGPVSISCLLKKLSKAMELGVEALATLSFCLFLLQLVHIIHSSSTTFKVDVFSSDTRLLVELNVLCLLLTKQDRHLQVEVENHDQLVSSTRLVEAMLDVREANIYLLALG